MAEEKKPAKKAAKPAADKAQKAEKPAADAAAKASRKVAKPEADAAAGAAKKAAKQVAVPARDKPRPAPKPAVAPKPKQVPERTLKVTQIASPIGREAYQRATLKGLGLNKIRRSRVLGDTPEVRGMIERVKHLVRVDAAS